jgi:PhnB protein
MRPSLAPWLTVPDGHKALDFYTKAFGATPSYRLEAKDGGLVLRLSVDGAEFWLSGGPAGSKALSEEGSLGGDSIRMILTVPDPDTFFARALNGGAAEVFPVGVAHGWRLGRLVDPFGLHWEIGHPVDEQDG